MVRTKAFEPSQALDKAMKLFWRNGYERTSVGELVAAMGINRGAYTTRSATSKRCTRIV